MTDKILIDRSVLEQALEALEHHVEQTRPIYKTTMAIEALIAALEQPQAEQEPVAWLHADGKHQPLYTHPQPKREPLTDVEILMALDAADIPDLPRDFKDVDIDIARAIEIAHGIGE